MKKTKINKENTRTMMRKKDAHDHEQGEDDWDYEEEDNLDDICRKPSQ